MLEEKVLKMVLMHPNSYTWERTSRMEKINIDRVEIENILKKYDINTLKNRRIIIWDLERIIYVEAKNVNSFEELIKNVKEKFIKEIPEFPINNLIIEAMIKRKALNSDENIELYKKVINNSISESEVEKYKTNILYWCIDLLAYYVIIKSPKNLTTNALHEIIEKKLEIIFGQKKNSEDIVFKRLKKIGFSVAEVRNSFKENFCRYRKDYENLLSIFNNNETKKERCTENKSKKEKNKDNQYLEVTENIIDMINSLVPEENKKENKKPQKNKKKSTKMPEIAELDGLKELEDKAKEKEKLKEMAKELNCVILDKEIIDDGEIILLRKLLTTENGAVLSELYNFYKNIDNVDKENAKAILGSFFAVLFSCGLDVETFVGNIGDEIEVDTKDILTKFKFSKPVDKEGKVKGKIKHYGFKYKGIRIMPMVIEPEED